MKDLFKGKPLGQQSFPLKNLMKFIFKKNGNFEKNKLFRFRKL